MNLRFFSDIFYCCPIFGGYRGRITDSTLKLHTQKRQSQCSWMCDDNFQPAETIIDFFSILEWLIIDCSELATKHTRNCIHSTHVSSVMTMEDINLFVNILNCAFGMYASADVYPKLECFIDVLWVCIGIWLAYKIESRQSKQCEIWLR